LLKKSHRKKTLIFGLSGVIINFIRDPKLFKNNSDGEMTIKNKGQESYTVQMFYRPFLFRLLSTLKRHFELILYSDLSREETDAFIKVFEKEERFFSYVI
jgi:hypothetical protein